MGTPRLRAGREGAAASAAGRRAKGVAENVPVLRAQHGRLCPSRFPSSHGEEEGLGGKKAHPA